MLKPTQHWQTRTPLRVQVLGFLFFVSALGLLGLLWSRWQLPFGLYLGLSLLALLYAVCAIKRRKEQTLYYIKASGFALQQTTNCARVDILHLWHNDWFLAVRLRLSCKHIVLVFWRDALTFSAWQQLTILLLHYQLQYQFADHKGAP